MSVNSSKMIPIKSRPVITNVEPLFIDKHHDRSTTVTVYGHGFWSNKNKKIYGIETTTPEVAFYGKTHVEVLRVFAIPRPAASRSEQYNIFTQSLCAYDLFSHDEGLQTKYPAFTGIEVETTAITENKLTFELPRPLSAAFVDVVVANRTGYSVGSDEYTQRTDQTAKYMTTLNLGSSGMILVC